MKMKNLRHLGFIAAAFGVCFADAHAALSKEPVIITNCRSFGVRADSESKTGLAARFAGAVEGDCDDINKVSANKILSVSGTMAGQNGVFALKAFYPDGQSYDHFILFKAFKDPSRDTELWMASSPDFARSTYAVAKSETDKTRPYGVFSDSYVAPSVVPAILYSLGSDLFVSDDLVSARRNYDMGLIRIYESIVGGSEGFTSDFVQSEDWFDGEKRAAALKTLRDFTLANFANIKVDNSLDPDGKSFADYMKIYSDEFVKLAEREAELQGKKLELEKTFALDDATYRIAKDVSSGAPGKSEASETSAPGNESRAARGSCEGAADDCKARVRVRPVRGFPRFSGPGLESGRKYGRSLKRVPGSARSFYIEREKSR